MYIKTIKKAKVNSLNEPVGRNFSKHACVYSINHMMNLNYENKDAVPLPTFAASKRDLPYSFVYT
jgi:hypothetical protein